MREYCHDVCICLSESSSFPVGGCFFWRFSCVLSFGLARSELRMVSLSFLPFLKKICAIGRFEMRSAGFVTPSLVLLLIDFCSSGMVLAVLAWDQGRHRFGD